MNPRPTAVMWLWVWGQSVGKPLHMLGPRYVCKDSEINRLSQIESNESDDDDDSLFSLLTWPADGTSK